MSVHSISRFTGLHKQTILSLMSTASQKAKALLDAKVQNIRPRFVQMDEMWRFVHTKEHNLGWRESRDGCGLNGSRLGDCRTVTNYLEGQR